RAGAVAAGAAGIDRRVALRAGDAARAGAHGAGRARALRGRLPLHPERDEQPADLRRPRLAVRDVAEHRRDLVARQVAAGDHRRDRLLDGHAGTPAAREVASASPRLMSRKLRRMRMPSPVTIDSGWNCTPSSGAAEPWW